MRSMLCLMVFMVIVSLAPKVQAAIVTQPVEYRQGDAVLEGYLAYDDARPGKRPGVLVVHEWWGLNDYAKQRAQQLAGMGYVALAADMYGKGKVTQDPKQAAQWAGEVRGNQALLRARAQSGFDVLLKQANVDPQRVAAIGFCFGGTTVLELAYSGAVLAGIVSFHGGITVPQAGEQGQIKAKILVLHGADDPTVKPDTITAFQAAMREGGVDWQMVYYGGAVHTFTNPAAGNDKSRGSAYDEKAAALLEAHARLFCGNFCQISHSRYAPTPDRYCSFLRSA